jgi:hypothetical protein
MNTSLYQLTAEYQAIANKLIEMDLDETTIKDTLESVAGDVETKAVNVALFIRNLESSAEQIKLAEKAMADRRKSLESKAESIKAYLKANMQACGFTKIESPYFALTIKKNPPKLVIDDESAIPVTFIEEKIVRSINNAAIKEMISSGEEVNGAHIEQGTRLDIK